MADMNNEIQQVMGPPRWQSVHTRPNIPKLLGRRFHLWKYRMTALFKESDLWGIVSGQSPRPDLQVEDETTRAWIRGNELAMRYILDALEDDQLIRIMHMDHASQMWTKLITANESTTATRKSVLIKEATSIKMKAGESAKDYVTRFSEVILQLHGLATTIDEEIQKVWLLKGLPKEYDMLKVALQNLNSEMKIDGVMTSIKDHYEIHKT